MKKLTQAKAFTITDFFSAIGKKAYDNINFTYGTYTRILKRDKQLVFQYCYYNSFDWHEEVDRNSLLYVKKTHFLSNCFTAFILKDQRNASTELYKCS